MDTKEAQALFDDGKKHAVALYHIADKLYKAACNAKDPHGIRLAARLKKQAMDLKDDALDFDGTFGGVTVKSGGT